MRAVRIILIAATALLVIAGWTHVRFDIDILRLLPDNLKQVEGLRLFLKHFSRDTELIITVEAASPDTTETAAMKIAEALRHRPDLASRAVAAPPWDEDPSGISEFAAYLLLNAPPEKIAAVAQELVPGKIEERIKETYHRISESASPAEIMQLSYDPLRFSEALGNLPAPSAGNPGEFVSSDGLFRAIYVEAPGPLGDYRQTIDWVASVRQLAIQTAPGATIGLTGEPAFMAEISDSMQWDMKSSGVMALLIIGAIFWFCHHRIRPLLYLLGMLILIFVISLGLAGLFLEELTVIGVGFAAIMVGLSVDFGYVLYQRWESRGGAARDLRQVCSPPILWAAGTTSAAFFMLNFSSLPGLSQLGNLVGIGVIVGALVMLALFAPLIARLPWTPPRPSRIGAFLGSPQAIRAGTWLVLGLVIALLGALVFAGVPNFDASTRAFRPRHSAANDALDKLSVRLTDERDFLSLIVSGTNEAEVLNHLREADVFLRNAVENHTAVSYLSPTPLWPSPDNQAANLSVLAPLAAEEPRLRDALTNQGFTEDAFALTRGVLGQWQAWQGQPTPLWPSSEASRWIMRRMASHAGGEYVALGIVRPAPGQADALMAAQDDGIRLVSWDQMGVELKRTIPGEFFWLVAILITIVFAVLVAAFRSVIDVLLSVGLMALVFATTAGTMALLGWEWNLFNLAARLLLLGTGVDYCIYMILALRRNPEDTRAAQRGTAKVIFQCAASAVAGFGAISWVSNLGLASMGRTCALGLTIDALMAIYLLPAAWRFCHRRKS